MRVLIIEDNSFNAFCLRRLLESSIASVSVTVLSNSQDALSAIHINVPDVVIIDGELSLVDELSMHGPQLATMLLQKYPHLPLIAWSDSEFMLGSFAKVFMQHNRLVNEYNIWTKTVSTEIICKTWAHYFGELIIGEKQQDYYRVGRSKKLAIKIHERRHPEEFATKDFMSLPQSLSNMLMPDSGDPSLRSG